MHPNLFSIGPLTVHVYGLLVALGILAASWYLTRNASWVDMTRDQMIDLIFVTTISGFVGARILYVIYDFDYFKSSPLEIFAIWHGGIIFYGGLVGGVLGFVVQVTRMKKSLLRSLDLFTPATALAQGFGRIGCFMNGCCYGKETSLPIGIRFPFHNAPLHPTQLYDAAFCFLLFALLASFYSKNSKREGTTSFLYFTLHPMGRFVIEFFRNDMPRLAFGFTLGQWMSALILATMVLTFFVRRFCANANAR